MTLKCQYYLSHDFFMLMTYKRRDINHKNRNYGIIRPDKFLIFHNLLTGKLCFGLGLKRGFIFRLEEVGMNGGVSPWKIL